MKYTFSKTTPLYGLLTSGLRSCCLWNICRI